MIVAPTAAMDAISKQLKFDGNSYRSFDSHDLGENGLTFNNRARYNPFDNKSSFDALFK